MSPGDDRQLEDRTAARDDATATAVLEPEQDRAGSNGDGPRASANGRAPRLAEGIELVGRYEDSGFKEPPFIARRSDGQVVQMPRMLYALAEVIDGRADEPELAARYSERIERQVEPEMVRTLLEEQLRPLGVVAPADGSKPELKKADPLLALKFRTKVVPQRLVHALTTVFKPLFLPPVVVAVMLAFVALVVWLFGFHGISQGLRAVLYDPALLLMLFGGVVLATTFHEIGHATGTRYGGAEPGVMGVGIYIVWPAFYTDITDAYRLDKRGRLRADLGGMYFNAVFALAVGGLYALTDFEPLLLLIVLQAFVIIQQSLPLLRLDGYYIVSDLTGVPDMLTRIKPVLQSLIPGREPDKRVTELKPWVRRVVTGYICTVVPLIAAIFVVMLVHAPRAFATGYDSLALNYSRLGPQLSHGETAAGMVTGFQMLVLVLPLLGITYTTARVAKRAGTGAWSWSADHPTRRVGVLAGTAAAAAALAFAWWPNGEYRPIQPGEKGTLLSAVRSLADVPGGRAALPPERARQLDDAPFHHDSRPDAGLPSAPQRNGSPTSREDNRIERERGVPSDGTAIPEEPTETPEEDAEDPVAVPQEPTATSPDPAATTPAPPATRQAPSAPDPTSTQETTPDPTMTTP